MQLTNIDIMIELENQTIIQNRLRQKSLTEADPAEMMRGQDDHTFWKCLAWIICHIFLESSYAHHAAPITVISMVCLILFVSLGWFCF